MRQFFNSLKDKKIIIFGTGSAAKAITEKIPLNIDYYLDNDKNKWLKTFQDRKILNPDELTKENIDNIIIFVSSAFYNEITKQLINIGLKENIHFINSLEFFFNPLDYDYKKAIKKEMQTIHIKINILAEYGFFEDAEKMICDYQQLVPLDERVYYLKLLVELSKKGMNKEKEYLLKTLKTSNYNIKLSTDFKKAERYNEEKKYVQSLEIYERILTQVDNDKIKEKIIDRIKNIYENEKDIKEQISKDINDESLIFKFIDNKINLHLMFDNFYCDRFIKFVNNNYPQSNHLFIILTSQKSIKYIDKKQDNIIIIQYSNSNREDIIIEIQKYIYSSKKVFIHFLSDFVCWLLFKLNRKENLYWIIWGADLYKYINNFKLYDDFTTELLHEIGYEKFVKKEIENQYDEKTIIRYAVIRNISYILTWNKGDYELVKKNFIAAAKYSNFFYLNPVDFNLLDDVIEQNAVNKQLREKFKNILLLGNSGDPSNNHLEILYELKEFINEDFAVVVPLSYGNSVYINKVITEGKKLLGEKFIPLTNFLQPEEYARVLNSIDVAFMNHNRQQGVGNIWALLYLGKKVYMKNNVTTYTTLNKLGVNLFDIDKVKCSNFSKIIEINKKIKNRNREMIYTEYNLQNSKKNIDSLLLNISL